MEASSSGHPTPAPQSRDQGSSPPKTPGTGRRNVELLPGLPDDLALLCLARVHRIHYKALAAASSAIATALVREVPGVRRRLGLLERSMFLVSWSRPEPDQVVVVEYGQNWCRRMELIRPDGFCETGGSTAWVEGTGLIVAGGRVRDKATNAVFACSLVTDTWTRLCPMKIARTEPAACAINDRFFVAGGNNQAGEALKTVEYVDLGACNRGWTLLPDMPYTAGDGPSAFISASGSSLTRNGAGQVLNVYSWGLLQSYDSRNRSWVARRLADASHLSRMSMCCCAVSEGSRISIYETSSSSSIDKPAVAQLNNGDGRCCHNFLLCDDQLVTHCSGDLHHSTKPVSRQMVACPSSWGLCTALC